MTASAADLVIVGAVLVSIVALLVAEAIVYSRGGIMGEFWASSLDDKLDHVVSVQRQWWLIGAVWMGLMAVTTAGMAGLTFLIADNGAGTVAWVSFGGFLVAAAMWLGGVTAQTGGVVVASRQRQETGETPSWIHPLWQSAYLTEGTWIVLANLAYIGFGVAILQTDLVGAWAGWVAIVAGAAIPIIFAITRTGFPQMSLLVPVVLGVALLIEGL